MAENVVLTKGQWNKVVDESKKNASPTLKREEETKIVQMINKFLKCSSLVVLSIGIDDMRVI